MNCFRTLSIISLVFLAGVGVGCSSSDSSSDKSGSSTGGGASCDPLNNYVATNPSVSLMNDVMPIFTSTTVNCSFGGSCHGAPPTNIVSGMTGFLLSDAASAKAALINVDSQEASMKRVVPGDVANSYLAHKVAASDPARTWGDPLGCISTCNGKATTNTPVGTAPCGLAMPQTPIGTIDHDQIVTILDWIADGAMD